MTQIELGDFVEDTVSGFKGTAVGRTEWLHGCNRIIVMPKVGKDGKPGENASFDEPQLKILKKRVVKMGSKKTGGKKYTPTKAKDTLTKY